MRSKDGGARYQPKRDRRGARFATRCWHWRELRSCKDCQRSRGQLSLEFYATLLRKLVSERRGVGLHIKRQWPSTGKRWPSMRVTLRGFCPAGRSNRVVASL